MRRIIGLCLLAGCAPNEPPPEGALLACQLSAPAAAYRCEDIIANPDSPLRDPDIVAGIIEHYGAGCDLLTADPCECDSLPNDHSYWQLSRVEREALCL